MNDVSMEDRIVRQLNRTWQYLGQDAVELCGGDVSRSQAIEFVTDAGRLTGCGGDVEAGKAFYALSKKEQDGILKKAFPFKWYS
jgi:hypothetical protein